MKIVLEQVITPTHEEVEEFEVDLKESGVFFENMEIGMVKDGVRYSLLIPIELVDQLLPCMEKEKKQDGE